MIYYLVGGAYEQSVPCNAPATITCTHARSRCTVITLAGVETGFYFILLCFVRYTTYT